MSPIRCYECGEAPTVCIWEHGEWTFSPCGHTHGVRIVVPEEEPT